MNDSAERKAYYAELERLHDEEMGPAYFEYLDLMRPYHGKTSQEEMYDAMTALMLAVGAALLAAAAAAALVWWLL